MCIFLIFHDSRCLFLIFDAINLTMSDMERDTTFERVGRHWRGGLCSVSRDDRRPWLECTSIILCVTCPMKRSGRVWYGGNRNVLTFETFSEDQE